MEAKNEREGNQIHRKEDQRGREVHLSMNSSRASFHARKKGTIRLILPYSILSIETLLGSPYSIPTTYHNWIPSTQLVRFMNPLVSVQVGRLFLILPFTPSAELGPTSLCNMLVAIWRICGEEISKLESEVGCGRCLGLCNLKGRYAYRKYYIVMLL